MNQQFKNWLKTFISGHHTPPTKVKIVKNKAGWELSRKGNTSQTESRKSNEVTVSQAGPSGYKPPTKRQLATNSSNHDDQASKKSKPEESPGHDEIHSEGVATDTDSSDVDWALNEEVAKQRKKKRKEKVRTQRSEAEEKRRIRKLKAAGKTDEDIFGPPQEVNDPNGPIESLRLDALAEKNGFVASLSRFDDEINRPPSSPKDGGSSGQEQSEAYTGDQSLFPDTDVRRETLLDPATGLMVTTQVNEDIDGDREEESTDAEDYDGVEFKPLTEARSPLVRDLMKALVPSMKFAEDNGVSHINFQYFFRAKTILISWFLIQKIH